MKLKNKIMEETIEQKQKTSLDEVMEIIKSDYKIDFVVEQVTFDGKNTAYFLKRKREIDVFIKKFINFEYEVNSLGFKINFKSPVKIEEYLRLQFSEPEGFRSNKTDL